MPRPTWCPAAAQGSGKSKARAATAMAARSRRAHMRNGRVRARRTFGSEIPQPSSHGRSLTPRLIWCPAITSALAASAPHHDSSWHTPAAHECADEWASPLHAQTRADNVPVLCVSHSACRDYEVWHTRRRSARECARLTCAAGTAAQFSTNRSVLAASSHRPRGPTPQNMYVHLYVRVEVLTTHPRADHFMSNFFSHRSPRIGCVNVFLGGGTDPTPMQILQNYRLSLKEYIRSGRYSIMAFMLA